MSSFESQKIHMWRQSIMEPSSTQKETLGALRILADGRKFRYAKVGGSNVQAGAVLKALAATANHIDLAVATAVAGATSVTVTLGATAATLNYYAGGYLQVNSGATALGHQYTIESHPAADSEATLVVTLKEPLKTALTNGTHKVSLIPSPWVGLVVADGAGVFAAGVAPCNITANYYAWIQTGGVACVEADTTHAVGANLFPAANGEAGVGPNVTNGAPLAAGPIIGYAHATAGVADECKPVILTID